MRAAAICALGACAALAGLSIAWSSTAPAGAALAALYDVATIGAFAGAAALSCFAMLDTITKGIAR